MNIIIVGCGKVGETLASHLNEEGHSIVVIDLNADTVESLCLSLDIMGFVGNGASYHVQKEAGIEDADLLIAVTDSDELNLLCCLIAKKAGNCKTIARVRNPIYNEEIGFIREELGLSMIINPEDAAANEIARLLRFPSAIKVEQFSRGKVDLLKIVITEDSVLNQMKVMDIVRKLHADVLVCTVERQNEVLIPNGDFILEKNDKISVIASPIKAMEFFKKIGIVNHQIRHAMIAGGGNLGYYVAKQLAEMGVSVKIIEKDKERCEELCELLPDATIIQGDATNAEILLEEGLEETEAFVSLTNLDEENIMLSLFAGNRSKAKLVTKVNRITFNDVINQLNLGSVISPKSTTANNILQFVRAMQNASGNNVETLYRIIDGKAEALSFRIKKQSAAVGVTLQELNIKKNILICSIIRNGRVITPRGQDKIQLNDFVIVVTTTPGLNDIEDILA